MSIREPDQEPGDTLQLPPQEDTKIFSKEEDIDGAGKRKYRLRKV